MKCLWCSKTIRSGEAYVHVIRGVWPRQDENGVEATDWAWHAECAPKALVEEPAAYGR
jgi:hypothetical protein